jgi:hypothetical protein
MAKGKTKGRAKPYDPAEQARRQAERERLTRRTPAMWGANDAALKLEANDAVRDEQDRGKGKTRRLTRFDCFETLAVETSAKAAVRRYEELLAVIHRCGGADKFSEYIDHGASTEMLTIRWIEASNVRDKLYGIDRHATRLIEALVLPAVALGQGTNWKAIVRQERGLIDRDAASRAVKQAAESLRQAYAEIDGQGVRRAA